MDERTRLAWKEFRAQVRFLTRDMEQKRADALPHVTSEGMVGIVNLMHARDALTELDAVELVMRYARIFETEAGLNSYEDAQAQADRADAGTYPDPIGP